MVEDVLEEREEVHVEAGRGEGEERERRMGRMKGRGGVRGEAAGWRGGSRRCR